MVQETRIKSTYCSNEDIYVASHPLWHTCDLDPLYENIIKISKRTATTSERTNIVTHSRGTGGYILAQVMTVFRNVDIALRIARQPGPMGT